MDVFDQPISADEDRRRISAEVLQLRQLPLEITFVGRAGEQNRILQSESPAEDAQLLAIARDIAGIFEAERDDFEPLSAIAIREFLEKRRFVVTVWAPAAGDRDDDNFIAEAFVSLS